MDAEPEPALTHAEIELINRLVKDSKRSREAFPLSRYLEKIAQLGGYLARTNDRRLETWSCGEACAGWPICSWVLISRPKDIGNRKTGITLTNDSACCSTICTASSCFPGG
jgi:hypothetical protein